MSGVPTFQCRKCKQTVPATCESITESLVCQMCVDKQHDPVNHPKHYTSHPSGVECITVTQHMNFCVGNAMKYLWRAGLKDEENTVQDLEKAKWYIDAEIRRIKKEQDSK